MQNRNNTIEERLQIINDYIQRTMDALNATRQVVQSLSSQNTTSQQTFVPTNVPGSITHSTFAPQLVQTPYGIVALNPQAQQQIPQLSQLPGQFAPVGFGFGLHHASWLPQLPVQQL